MRDEVHREAIRRIFGRRRLTGKLASRILANGSLEKFYYQSRFFRKIIEVFRYRLAPGKGSI